MAQKHINPIQSREQVIKASESNFTELYNMASQGEPNVIEEVQVNGTALPVDSNKAVNVIVPTALSQLSNDSGFITSADIPPQEMYWCTYGTTTYAEITQAVADGKVPMIKYNGITYMYSKDWGSSLGHLFGTMDANFDRWVYCKQTNVWGTGYMEVENAVNKKTSISSTSTNVQYPSAKAVWDALPKKTSDLTNDSGFITSADLPTVNNATLTIQKNGTNVATFDANASSNVTANITVPTNVSELANDSNFVSTSDIDQIYDGTSSNAQSGVAIDGALQPIIAVAQGKTKSYVIQGQSDITGTKDANEEYTNVTAITGITLADLQVGDIINLKDLNVPDYWVSQVSPSVSLNKMETTKVDLSDYVDKSNAQTITGIKTFYESDGSATSSSKIILKGEHLNKTTNPSSNRFLSIDFRDKNGTTLTKFSTIQTSDGYSGFIAGAGTDPTSPSNNLLMLVNNSNNSKLLLIPATASHSYSAVRRDFYNNNTVTLSGNQTIGGTKTFSATPVFSSGEIGDSTHTFTLPSTNGQLALVTDISYPVTSVNGQTGAVSLSIPTALSELTNDTNFATTNDLANYLPLIGGTMTGAITTIENQAGIILRGHASYLAGISYRTNGDEAMCFENKYAPASWIFRNKSPTSYSTSWTDVTPSMQIKNQCVAINKLIPSGSNGSYNLDVSGTANATTIYENGTALSSKYMDINTTIPTALSQLTNDVGLIPNGSYRGTFGNWSLVPTTTSGYEADDNGNTTPLKNDYMVVNDGSGKLDDSSFIYLPDTTGGGASFGCTYNGITQTVKYTSATGEANAKTLNNVINVYYNSNTGKWVVKTLRSCTFDNVNYNTNDVIAQWGYSSYREGYVAYSQNTNGGIFVYDGVWGTDGKNGWKVIASINSMVSGVLSSIPTKTSDITNDSGFITSADLPTKTSDLTNDSGFITSSAIPTNVSAFTNDSGYLTSAVTSLGGKSGALTLGSGLSITAGGEVYATGTGAKIVDLGTITLPYTLSDAQYNEVLNNDNVILKYTTSNSTQYVKKLMSFGDYIYFDKTYKDYDSNDGGLGYIMPTIKKSTKKLTHEVQSIFFVGNGLTYDTSTESLAVDTTTIALKSDIPTESTVSGWGFTKNTGTITGVQLNGTSIATSGVANVKALPNFNLNISHQTAGNPRPVKFLTINYATAATYFKMSATSCHDNGTSYQFLEDIIIGCTTSGSVVCNVYKYCQQTVTYDSATRNYGDVFYVIDTTNKIVDFYILCGQYASSQFTPATKIGNTTIAYITQYTGTATYYSSGTKVWANGNSTTYAKLSDVPDTSTFYPKSGGALNDGAVITMTGSNPYVGLQETGGTQYYLQGYQGEVGISVSGNWGTKRLSLNANGKVFIPSKSIGDGTYTYTLPSKTGTLRLNSTLITSSSSTKVAVSTICPTVARNYLLVPYSNNYLYGYNSSGSIILATSSPIIIKRASGATSVTVYGFGANATASVMYITHFAYFRCYDYNDNWNNL